MGVFLFINLTLAQCASNILNMKKIASILFGLLLIGDANAFVNRQNAVVTLLDKASGKTHSLTLPVGQNVSYEKLTFVARSCKQNDPFQAENAFIFVEISQNNNLIFSGWMNRNEPGENPLQNADYDVWLVRCE